MVFGFHERIAQDGESRMLGCPQIQRKSSRDGVDLVNKQVTLGFIPEQVNANDALETSDLSNSPGQLGSLVVDGLWRLGGKLARSVREACSRTTGQILLLIRIQPSLFAFTAQRTLEICHLEGRIGPEGDVQVNKLWPIGLDDCASLQVG